MKHVRCATLFAALAGGAALLSGCASMCCPPEECALLEVVSAVCTIHPTAGNTCAGVVTFRDVEGGVEVHASLTGLTPGQKHGFHIHEFAFTGSADALCTGGHYDPEKTAWHALPEHADRPHHAGDMGNLIADAHGKAEYTAVIPGITVARRNAILGRAVIIHAKPDDGGQPVGNAGARIGVGNIGIAAPQAHH